MVTEDVVTSNGPPVCSELTDWVWLKVGEVVGELDDSTGLTEILVVRKLPEEMGDTTMVVEDDVLAPDAPLDTELDNGK